MTPNKSLLIGGFQLPFTTLNDPQRVIGTRWGLSSPFHLWRQRLWPPTSHYNSLSSPFHLDASNNDPQWVPMTRWGLLSPFNIQRWWLRPPMSLYDSLGPFSSLPRPSMTPNESLWLVGGLSSPFQQQCQPQQLPMSHYDSLGGFLSLPPQCQKQWPPTSLWLVGGFLLPSTTLNDPQQVLMTRWGSPHPSNCNAGPNDPQWVIMTRWGVSSPFHFDASNNDPQRVPMTRWGLSPPFHHPQRPPTSHRDLLGALISLPLSALATTTPNESLQLVGGFLCPSTTHNDPQLVPMTRWRLLSPFHPQCWWPRSPTSHCDLLWAFSSLPLWHRQQWPPMTHWGLSSPFQLRCQLLWPPMSLYDSLGAFTSLPPPSMTPNESLWLVGGFPLSFTTHNEPQWVFTTHWGISSPFHHWHPMSHHDLLGTSTSCPPCKLIYLIVKFKYNLNSTQNWYKKWLFWYANRLL